MPQTTCTQVAGLHVIMLGCYTDFDRHSKQYKWLKKDLAKVDRSRTPWLVVGMHAPWYNSNVAHQGEVESMRSSMETLLFENGVDAVFAGELSILIITIRLFSVATGLC